eukprot:2311469-Lingulodinium_polyedra.AAC.1
MSYCRRVAGLTAFSSRSDRGSPCAGGLRATWSCRAATRFCMASRLTVTRPGTPARPVLGAAVAGLRSAA